MEKIKELVGSCFCGNEASDYAKEHGYLDYRTLVKAFDAVPAGNIMNATNYEDWETENGSDYNEDTEEYAEIFQFFIISSSGAEILETYTDEIVYYNSELDIYMGRYSLWHRMGLCTHGYQIKLRLWIN